MRKVAAVRPTRPPPTTVLEPTPSKSPLLRPRMTAMMHRSRPATIITAAMPAEVLVLKKKNIHLLTLKVFQRAFFRSHFVSGGPQYRGVRRKSVFAETYDPEEDEQDEKVIKLGPI